MNMVSKDDIIARLKTRRNALELSFQDLADLTGMSKSTLQRYESGAIKNIPLSRVENLASALQTTPEYLMGWDNDPLDYERIAAENGIAPPCDYDGEPIDYIKGYINELENTSKYQNNSAAPLPKNILPIPQSHLIPVVGSIACGTPILAEQNIEDYEPCPDYVSADFALHCKGDSMINARIYDGDTVFIREQPDVENGEIAAVEIIDGSICEATLKRFYRNNNTVTLVAENPSYPPMTFSNGQLNNIKVIGKAVYFLSEVK